MTVRKCGIESRRAGWFHSYDSILKLILSEWEIKVGKLHKVLMLLFLGCNWNQLIQFVSVHFEVEEDSSNNPFQRPIEIWLFRNRNWKEYNERLEHIQFWTTEFRLSVVKFFASHFDVRFMLLTKLCRQMSDDGDDTMTMTTTTSVCKTKRSSSAHCSRTCAAFKPKPIYGTHFVASLLAIGFLLDFCVSLWLYLVCVVFVLFCVPLAFSTFFPFTLAVKCNLSVNDEIDSLRQNVILTKLFLKRNDYKSQIQ